MHLRTLLNKFNKHIKKGQKMSPLTEQLGNIEPGEPLGAITYGDGGRVYQDTTLNEGIVPESSSLGGESIRVYVATDETGKTLAAVALEQIHDGGAKLIIRSRSEQGRTNIALMRGVIREAMTRSHVQSVHTDPELADLSADTLEGVGFQPRTSGSDELIMAGV
jgi:hypothetical protein